MKLSQPHSILSMLFFPYALLFTFFLLLTNTFYITMETQQIKQNAISSVENNIISISENLEMTVQSLDTISQNIIYSNLVKEQFMSYLNYSTTNASDNYEEYLNLKNTKILTNLLVTMIGPNFPVDQVYLYGLDYGCFGIGLDNSSHSQSVQGETWYEDVSRTHGEKYLFLEIDENLKKYFSYDDGKYFITLCRMFYNSLNLPQGIIEVKKSFTDTIDSIKSLNRSYEESYLIYNDEGTCMYSTSDTASINYYSIITNDTIPYESLTQTMLKYHNGQHIISYKSPYTGFTIVAVIKNGQLMRPIKSYLLSHLSFNLLSCLLIVILSYIIARKISNPIVEIYTQLLKYKLTDTYPTQSTLHSVNTSIKELQYLNQALINMEHSINISLQKQLQLKNREIQSQMLALQSQMNPHFLHNSLATIQALAEENLNDHIIMMCQNISRILRYISTDKEPLVDLNSEIFHTEAYLQCMKIRHGNNLIYQNRLDKELYNCKVPKLCLQMIVENAVKYVTAQTAPWHIEIYGSLHETHWEITVKDNGPGFSEEKLKELNHLIDEIDNSGLLPNLKINGMGLMNIYIRFKLLYNGKHIFKLQNNYPSGAIVTIGGFFDETNSISC